MQKKECTDGVSEGTCSSRLQLMENNGEKKRNDSRVGRKGLGYGAAMMSADRYISCTTFNILAPIYKRLDKEDQSHRESQHMAFWLSRNQCIIGLLLLERSSIICQQEVGLGNDELVEMYGKML